MAVDGGGLSLRLIDATPQALAQLQRVLEAAPGYTQRVTGLPVGAADAQSTFSAMPPGKSYEDKFVFGIHLYDGVADAEDDPMIGCIDLIRDWPVSGTAHIGLLLLAESHQRRGFGSRAFALLRTQVAAWGRCDRLRLGVLECNAQALPFWTRLGFEPNGEIKPYEYANVRSRVIVMERGLEG